MRKMILPAWVAWAWAGFFAVVVFALLYAVFFVYSPQKSELPKLHVEYTCAVWKSKKTRAKCERDQLQAAHTPTPYSDERRARMDQLVEDSTKK